MYLDDDYTDYPEGHNYPVRDDNDDWDLAVDFAEFGSMIGGDSDLLGEY